MSDFRARIVAELDTSEIPSSISKIEKQKISLNNFTLDTKGLGTKIQQALNSHQFTLNLTNVKVDNLSKTITGQMTSTGSQAGQQFSQSFLTKINSQINNGGIDSSIARITQKFNQLNGVVNSMGDNNSSTILKQKLTSLESEFITLHTLQEEFAKGGISDNQLVQKYEQFNNTLLKIKNNMTVVTAETKQFATATEVATLQNKMESWLNKNSRAKNTTYGIQVQNYTNTLKNLSAQGNVFKVELNKIANGFKEVDMAAESAGLKGKSFGKTLQGAFSSISKYVSVSTIIYQSIAALKEMYQNVYNVDTAMTELKKVTDETNESYSQFLDNAGAKAKEIGTTVSDYITSTSDFARLGYSFEDSQDLAEVANIYYVVGDELDSIDTATQSVISTLAAFDIEAENSISIVDKMNEVGNNFAISSGGIGEALTRSASSMVAANNTLDETIALITAANTVVQDPESVGTAFKTISMRIRGATSELEEAGLDTDGMADSVSTLRKEIKALSGVDIMIDDETFKSTYEIIKELSEVWEDLTDVSQANITELLAGKRQGNIISAVMSNFDIAEDALETSLNSTGSAMSEHEKWMESLEAKTQTFKATWEDLSNDFLDSDFLKGLVDSGTNALNIIDFLTEHIGSLSIAIAGVQLGAFIKNFDQLKRYIFPMFVWVYYGEEIVIMATIFNSIG